MPIAEITLFDCRINDETVPKLVPAAVVERTPDKIRHETGVIDSGPATQQRGIGAKALG